MEKSAGFTLVELIVTLVLAALVLALGVSSFQEMIRSNRLTTIVNELVGALNLARSEAIKRGVPAIEVPVTVEQRLHGHSKKPAVFRYGMGFANAIVRTWLR